jgi:predicted HAD superfamily Cof-like phosphohydrolase
MSDRERMGQAEFQDEAREFTTSALLTNDIAAFHTKFQLHYGGEPRELPVDMALFRIGFMCEELAEYAQACGFTNIARTLNDLHQHIKENKRWVVNQNELRDVEKQFDSLIDLTYVALGTSYLQGFDFDEGWRRVHGANMAKVLVGSDLAGSTRGSKYDVIKPRGWKPADLSDLVASAAAVAAEKLMKP